MTPQQLKALLDAATKRPWDAEQLFDLDAQPNGKIVFQAVPPGDNLTAELTDGDADAIVATMNAAEALVALWEAADAYIRDVSFDNVRRIKSALRRLEELP